MSYDRPIRFNAFRLLGVLLTSVIALTAVSPASPNRGGQHSRAARAHGDASTCSLIDRPGQGLLRFVNRLRPGQIGCLAPGDYAARRLVIRPEGKARARITLRSLDRRHPATIHGLVWLSDTANYWTFDGLNFDGRNASGLPSPLVNGDHSVWTRDDITNHQSGAGRSGGGICFSLGENGRYGVAGDTIIEQSRIHDCGISDNANHGIYITATAGTTIIRDNWIFRNGDRGIQLYPNAQHVVIARNVIDNNGSGVIFSGEGDMTSRDVIVVRNIISNSRNRWNVESWYPAGTPPGTGNIVADNCFWASATATRYREAGGIAPQVGFTATQGNVVQRPVFASSGTGDLRLTRRSGCRGFGPPTTLRPPLG